MATSRSKPKLLVVVGPTASGKSDLALKVAKEFNGEIICADSRTIYKDMNIGTAKPSRDDQKCVPHWGLDLVKPGQNYNASKFKKYAKNKITEVQGRGKLPILVGGTGLYVDSVLFDFSFVKASRLRRLIYSTWSIEKLQKIILEKDWPLPENMQNKRHLVAAAARRGKSGAKTPKPLKNTLIIGLMPEDEVIKKRLAQRANKYLQQGLIEETRRLLSKYGQKRLVRSSGISYPAIIKLIKGEITTEVAIEHIAKQEWQYARRQRTWFKRNKFIKWFGDSEKAFEHIYKILDANR